MSTITILGVLSFWAGWRTLTHQTSTAAMFEQWGVPEIQQTIFGIVTLVGSLMLAHPKTVFFGNYLIQTIIIFIVGQHVIKHNWTGVASEVPVLILSFLVYYLGHPLGKN